MGSRRRLEQSQCCRPAASICCFCALASSQYEYRAAAVLRAGRGRHSRGIASRVVDRATHSYSCTNAPTACRTVASRAEPSRAEPRAKAKASGESALYRIIESTLPAPASASASALLCLIASNSVQCRFSYESLDSRTGTGGTRDSRNAPTALLVRQFPRQAHSSAAAAAALQWPETESETSQPQWRKRAGTPLLR